MILVKINLWKENEHWGLLYLEVVFALFYFITINVYAGFIAKFHRLFHSFNFKNKNNKQLYSAFSIGIQMRFTNHSKSKKWKQSTVTEINKYSIKSFLKKIGL